jgi:hypothetical protein
VDEKRGHLNSHHGNPLKGIGDQKQVSRTIQLVKQNKDPFTLKKHFLRHKKNYENSNISPCKKKYIYIYIIFKNPHIKIDLLLLPRGQNPLSYHTL